jgi:Ras-related protein Rab-1A
MNEVIDTVVDHQLIFLGDSLVGKTTTLLKYFDQNYNENTLTTIGLDIKKKNIKIIDDNGEEKEIEVKFIDTAGQERFRTITANYYKHADGIILMFDVTQEESFQNITNWIGDIKEKCKTNIPIFILGNKIDLSERIKSKDEFEMDFKKLNYDYYEISAKQNINVKETIDKMCLLMYKFKLSESKKIKTQNSVLMSQNSNKKKKCCSN